MKTTTDITKELDDLTEELDNFPEIEDITEILLKLISLIKELY